MTKYRERFGLDDVCKTSGDTRNQDLGAVCKTSGDVRNQATVSDKIRHQKGKEIGKIIFISS